MGKQIEVELYKLLHSRTTYVSLIGYLFLLLIFFASGSVFMMVAGNLSVPSESIGFFKGIADGINIPIQISVLRSAHSFIIFSWLIGLNLCISTFSSETKNRTLSLYICEGGKAETLYIAKMFAICIVTTILQLIFTLLCLFLMAGQLNYPLTTSEVMQTVGIALLNSVVLLAFLEFSVFMLTLLRSRIAVELILCLIPLIGAILYGTSFAEIQATGVQTPLVIKILPTYYWANLASLRLIDGIIWEALIYSILLFCGAAMGTVILLKHREMK